MDDIPEKEVVQTNFYETFLIPDKLFDGLFCNQATSIRSGNEYHLTIVCLLTKQWEKQTDMSKIRIQNYSKTQTVWIISDWDPPLYDVSDNISYYRNRPEFWFYQRKRINDLPDYGYRDIADKMMGKTGYREPCAFVELFLDSKTDFILE